MSCSLILEVKYIIKERMQPEMEIPSLWSAITVLAQRCPL